MAGVRAVGSWGCQGSLMFVVMLAALASVAVVAITLVELDGCLVHHLDIIQLGLELAANIG